MKTFEELGVAPQIRRAIEEMGYETPMPVQEKVIPYLLGDGNDLIALAQTGTGKTAAFGLPILQRIEVGQNHPQALILCPTRELCLQIAGDLADYSKYMDRLKVLPVYGGSSIESQISALKRGVHIVVATPGRLLDLMNRRTVSLKGISNVILDEADEMLNMGFTESIDEILASVPEERNMLFFSATMPDGISRITRKYMKSPTEIVIGNKNESTANVKHSYFCVHAKDKYLALKRIADYNPNIYGIIFCRTRRETQEIAEKLIEDGYNADSLHGELSQAQRDSVMNKFRQHTIQLLVATDVAARGLDVDHLTHVINYGLPDEIESYTHRSGRTGRAGRTGLSIAIINLKEKHKIRDIEKKTNKTFEVGHIPGGKEICEKQLFSMVDKIEKVKVDLEQIDPLLDPIFRKLEWLTKEDLLKRVLSLEFNRLLAYYDKASDLENPLDQRYNKDKKERREVGAPRMGGAEAGYKRFFINAGKLDGLFPNTLMELINKNCSQRIQIGKIDLMKKFSFFEVEEKSAAAVLAQIQRIDFMGRPISVEPAENLDIKDGAFGKSAKKYRSEDSFKRGDRPTSDKGYERKKRSSSAEKEPKGAYARKRSEFSGESNYRKKSRK